MFWAVNPARCAGLISIAALRHFLPANILWTTRFARRKVEAVNSHSFFSRICHFPICRLAAVTLVALAWSSLAFCGEIQDAARDRKLGKVNALLKGDTP